MTYQGRHPKTMMQRTYGGQVLAQAIMAAYHTMPDDRVMHSLHATFLRPGDASHNIYYLVDAPRDGRTFSTRRIRAEQDYREICSVSFSFHPFESGLDHGDAIPADIPAPESCPRLGDVMTRRFGKIAFWNEWDALDVHFAGDSSTGLGSASGSDDRARMRVWVKTVGELPDDFRLHQAILAYLSDLTLLSVSVLPHEIAFLSTTLQTASIDHAMWFHREFRADEWLLYDMVSPSASHALGFSQGRLFQDGVVVASCAQEGLIRQVRYREILQ